MKNILKQTTVVGFKWYTISIKRGVLIMLENVTKEYITKSRYKKIVIRAYCSGRIIPKPIRV